MTQDQCEYPGCTAPQFKTQYCRRHTRSLAAAQESMTLARLDRAPVTTWTCVFILTTGLHSRVATSNDPVRRRDEAQAGCPLNLSIASIVLANRLAASGIAWMAEARLARLHHDLADPPGNLRNHWYAVCRADAEQALPDVARGVDGNLWATPRELAEADWSLTDPGERRILDLLEMLHEEKVV